MIPEWLPYATQRFYLAANRIVAYVATNGVHTTVNNQHIIGAQISYQEFQRECHLSRSAVASGIRLAAKVKLLYVSRRGNQAAFYAIPVYAPGMEQTS